MDLDHGRISGRDSFFTYGGSYRVDERHFSAVLTVNRHADGPPSVFGPDEVEVNLAGVCNGLVATCSGTAREAPDVKFEATLIYSQEDAPAADAKCAVVKLNADKLPKGSTAVPGRATRSRPPRRRRCLRFALTLLSRKHSGTARRQDCF